MKFVHCLAALSAAAFASGALADTRGIYGSASFIQVGSGVVELNGFGRGSNTTVSPLSLLRPLAVTEARQNFFDTWNIDSSGISAGTYNFDNWVIDATGSLLFGNSGFSVGLNYIDESGVRFTEFFDVNASGTQAVGSGTFTVRSQCPIASCIWLDIMGTQETGMSAGYGGAGALVASVVPEPTVYSLMALGLLAVGAAARRRSAGA
jgi:hypothetical protein